MIRFGISEYIRNFWFNLCMIILLLVMMVISTILISNVDEQMGPYRLAEKYMDEESMFLSEVLPEHMEELKSYGEVLAVQTIYGRIAEDDYSSIIATVYTEEVMNKIRPSLDFGRYPMNVKSDDNTIRVLISHNPYGIKAGDTFAYAVNTIDGENLSVQIYVAGVISEGQKLYTEIDHVFRDMTYEDFFPIYSYEQTEKVRMLIPEEELQKIPVEKVFSMFCNIMINPDDDLSDKERAVIWEKIKNYGIDYTSTGVETPYPSALELVERNDILYKNILMKYLPLCMIVILLFSISIIGMVTIKTVKSTRYYGIMYTCGMRYITAQIIAGMEMVFNCVMAFMSTVVLLTLQKVFNIVGEINCNLDAAELIIMVCVCVVTVVGSILATRGVLKEHTPVEILINTN